MKVDCHSRVAMKRVSGRAAKFILKKRNSLLTFKYQVRIATDCRKTVVFVAPGVYQCCTGSVVLDSKENVFFSLGFR